MARSTTLLINVYANSPFNDSSHAYSKAWNRSIASKLTLLPRELRDTVYSYIWSDDYLVTTHTAMAAVIRTGGIHSQTIPHVVDVNYVCAEIAREVVEAYYRRAPSLFALARLCPFQARCPEVIENILCDDSFGVGIDPAKELRALRIVLNLDDLNKPSNIEVDVEGIQPSPELLSTLAMKKDFDLHIELVQRRIRLKLWPAYIRILRPILLALEKEDARVQIVWSHHMWHRPPIQRDFEEISSTRTRRTWNNSCDF